MKRIHIASLLSLVAFVVNKGVISAVHAQEPSKPVSIKSPSPALRVYKHPVTVWVPPYAIAKSKTQIMASFENVGVKDGITHLALQFWVPTKEGTVEFAKLDEVKDSAIIELRDWAHQHGVRVLLCVYNHVEKWDWSLARTAFADHQETFVKSLITEMERLGLDGIDIDLEGEGTFETDKEVFLAFMTTLSKELRARGKHLTVDSFAYVWNAPNQNWWPDLFPLVDALTTMGYEQTGYAASEWRAYEAQKKAAGSHTAKLQIGMPGGREQWQGNTVIEQLRWVQKDGATGMAIWDAQLRSPAWKTSAVWKTIQEIRGTP